MAIDSSPPGITISDVAMNTRSAPTAFHLHFCIAKTNSLGKGVEISLGASGTKVCPVVGLLSYLVVRPSVEGQLFVEVDGKPLWRSVFVGRLQRGLQVVGLEMNQYSGHSLRIGVATSTAAAGRSQTTSSRS